MMFSDITVPSSMTKNIGGTYAPALGTSFAIVLPAFVMAAKYLHGLKLLLSTFGMILDFVLWGFNRK